MIDRPIIFFDSECGICNKFVQFILINHRNDDFYLACINSDTANKIGLDPKIDSIVYYSHFKKYYFSSAVIATSAEGIANLKDRELGRAMSISFESVLQ